MNLLGSICYDPATAVSQVSTSLLAMTALDTANARVAFTIPAHGKVKVYAAVTHHGSTTIAQTLIGCLEGASLRGRVAAQTNLLGTAIATSLVKLEGTYTLAGLTPGAVSWDLAVGVEIVASASGAFKWGGPNDTTTNNAFGALVLEIWDPQPIPTAAAGAAGGLFIAGTNAATTVTTALTTTFTGNLTGSVGSVTGAVGSVTGAVGSVTGNVGGNVVGSVGSVTGAVGSVTGAVGSVTGAVGSVTGAVGSVAGNVGGNVTGSVGSVVGLTASNLDATVSSRASATNLATAQTGIDDLPTNAELATALGTADDAVLAQVALVKAKTDLIPAVPATAGSITTLQTSVDDLPTNAELATALGTADDAVLTAVAAVQSDTDNIQTRLPAALVGGKMDSTATVTGTVNADVKKVNGVTVTGTGVLGDEWGPV